ncbi:MAG: hypothetical protein K2Q01_04755, partial [Rickettsiales bacterium]|nr:hypothetical protein [Rickettsiales bacterium]
MDKDQHDNHNSSANTWLKPLAIGAVAVSGALILAPYVLPFFGIGSSETAVQSMKVMHTAETGSSLGSGLAGAINSLLAEVPLIGDKLAQGGVFTALASGAVAIGGIVLGNHLQSKEDGKKKFSTGKLVRTLSLITSALIALPSVLTGLGIGIVYLCATLGDNVLAGSAASTLYNTLGTMGGAFKGPGLAASAFAALPHLLTCGAALAPALFSFGLFGGKEEHKTQSFEARSQPAPEPAQNPNYTDGSLSLRIQTQAPLEAGKRTDAKLTITHKDTGAPVTTEDLAVKHTEKMHLFIVDQSMKD